MTTSVKRICVFCGSSTGNKPAFAEQAALLGAELAERGIGLVYGGGNIGLMNEVAEAVLAGGGEVQGVIPVHLKERAHENLSGLHITNSMHERKAMMAELSDAFIALPGGFGTFEELLEIITWSQLQLHRKPVILFNVDGYYNKLIDFFDQAVGHGFIREEMRTIPRVASTVEECLDF